MAARRKIFKRKRTRFRERHSFGPLPKNDRKRTTREREGVGKTREIARRRLGVRGVRRKAQGSRKNRNEVGRALP